MRPSASSQGPGPLSISLLQCPSGHRVLSILDASGRCVGRRPRATEAASPIIFFRPSRHPYAGFILRADDPSKPISLDHDLDVHPVLSFIIENQHEETVALRVPTSDFYVCSVPAEVSSDAELCCNRLGVSDWERFTPVVPELGEIADLAIRLMREINAAFSETITASAIRAWLIRTPAEIVTLCGAAVLRVMPPNELRILAGWILDDDNLFTAVRTCLDNDIWTRRLAELRQWNIARTPVSKLALDESWDRCATELDWNRNVCFGEVLLGLMREHVVPRQSVCIMTTVRNEGLYLLEWIAHHRALGVEHFFVYSNQNDDASDLLLDQLARHELITWVSNTMKHGVNPQTRAYTHCLSHLTQPLDYKWTILIDLDEFVVLNPDRYNSLDEFLDRQELRGADAVSMHWSMLTPCGEGQWSPKPLIERFRFREPLLNRHIKSAFITARHVSSYPHNPIATFKRPQLFLNAAGQVHHSLGAGTAPHQGEPNFDHAWIAHYFYKSLDEWIWKMSRGFDARDELMFEPQRLEIYLRYFDQETSEADGRALHHLDGLNLELQRLRNIPGLAHAEAVVRETFLTRVATLKALLARRIRRTRMFDTGSRLRILSLLAKEMEAAVS